MPGGLFSQVDACDQQGGQTMRPTAQAPAGEIESDLLCLVRCGHSRTA